MDSVTAQPAHILMQRKQADNHVSKPESHGTAAAFASYGFGPLDMEGSKGKKDQPVSGAGLIGNPLNAHSLSWVTTVQAADSSGAADKAT